MYPMVNLQPQKKLYLNVSTCATCSQSAVSFGKHGDIWMLTCMSSFTILSVALRYINMRENVAKVSMRARLPSQ